MKERITVTTWLGHEIDLLQGPTPDQVDIRDIAHGLSMICRFNGAINRSYSVAEHCLYVARHAPREYAIYYLMHDCPEYLTGDWSTPVKKLLFGVDYKKNPKYRKITRTIERAIFEGLDLDYERFLNLERTIKEADLHVYQYECRYLRGKDAIPVESFQQGEPLHGSVFGMPQIVAESAFENMFNRYNKLKS